MAYFSFDDPMLFSASSVENGIWPCTDEDLPLRFHPEIIYRILPPSTKVLKNKQMLITAFIEFARSLDLLYLYYGLEFDNDIKILRQYIELIFNNYGEDDMRYAINIACLGAKSVERLIDIAADGFGSWRA
jgi:hypothetical protein